MMISSVFLLHISMQSSTGLNTRRISVLPLNASQSVKFALLSIHDTLKRSVVLNVLYTHNNVLSQPSILFTRLCMLLLNSSRIRVIRRKNDRFSNGSISRKNGF